jgi:hypothetical protein
VLFSVILGNLHRYLRRRRAEPAEPPGPDARFLARATVALVVLVGVIILLWSLL